MDTILNLILILSGAMTASAAGIFAGLMVSAAATVSAAIAVAIAAFGVVMVVIIIVASVAYATGRGDMAGAALDALAGEEG